MLRKVNNSLAIKATGLNHLLCIAYKTLNPIEPKTKGQCRFMLFVRLRPGVPSHFDNQERTGYYPGDKYTDKEPEMLRNLIRLLSRHMHKYDRMIIYDNHKSGDEKEVLKIVDGTIESRIHLYSIMLAKYILPDWIKLQP